MNPAERWPVDRRWVWAHDARVLAAFRKKLLHPPSFWMLNLTVWMAFGVIALLIRVIMHEDVGRALGLTLAAETLGFLLSGVLRSIYKHIGGRFLRLPVFAAALVLTLFTAIVQSGVVQLIVTWTGWHHVFWSGAERWVLLATSMWFVYMSWSLGYFWVKAELAAHAEALRAAESRHAAQKMELELLRAQLDPHFLFNSLNGVATEIGPHPETATAMVRELADYLRYSLDHRHDQITPLAVELDAVAAYLRIEKTRFGDRLETGIEAEAAARAARIPSFLLQPLIENAFKHGFAAEPPPWVLRIAARTTPGGINLSVTNTGRFRAVREGVGLATVRRRLELHYPGRHRFTIGGADGIVTATIDLEGEPCSV